MPIKVLVTCALQHWFCNILQWLKSNTSLSWIMPDLGATSWAFTTLARKRRWGGHLDLVVIPPKTTWLGLLHSANLVSPTELEVFLSDRNSLHQDLHPCKYLLHWTAPLHWMLPFLVRRPHKQVEMFRIWNTQIQSCFVYTTSRHWVDHS